MPRENIQPTYIRNVQPESVSELGIDEKSSGDLQELPQITKRYWYGTILVLVLLLKPEY